MIKVTIEILPGGYVEGQRTIGLMHIVNISNLGRQSDYRFDLTEGENPLARTKAFACTVYVRDHGRILFDSLSRGGIRSDTYDHDLKWILAQL